LSGRSHRCRGRWPPSSREERRKLSSREEAIVDVPWGHPYAPHRRERELVVRPAVLDLGEDAREASRRGRRSRTLGSGWPVVPLSCLARAATGTSTPPSHHASLSSGRRRSMPRLSHRRRASLTPPQRCRRYEHDATAPRLARTVAGMSTTPTRLTHAVVTVVAHAAVVAAAAKRVREREREDAQMKDEVTPRTQGEHEKIRTKWTPRTACFEFFN
jgi:hypothetical protein